MSSPRPMSLSMKIQADPGQCLDGRGVENLWIRKNLDFQIYEFFKFTKSKLKKKKNSKQTKKFRQCMRQACTAENF